MFAVSPFICFCQSRCCSCPAPYVKCTPFQLFSVVRVKILIIFTSDAHHSFTNTVFLSCKIPFSAVPHTELVTSAQPLCYKQRVSSCALLSLSQLLMHTQPGTCTFQATFKPESPCSVSVM